MASAVDVVNIALSMIGQNTTVSSLNPSDGSAASNVASTLYPSLINNLHRAANWNFCRKQISLTQIKAATINGAVSTNPPVQPWQYEYAWPSDCIKARFILPYLNISAGQSIPFTTADNAAAVMVAGGPPPSFQVAMDVDQNNNPIRIILCNVPQAQLVYTTLITQPDLWDAAFFEAACATLAAWFVNALARNRPLMMDMIKIAQNLVSEARISDGNEGLTTVNRDASWISFRGIGPGLTPTGNPTWDLMSWPGGLLL